MKVIFQKVFNFVSVLSIRNFNYVRRPLGVNNAAYEILRKGTAAEPEREKAADKSTPAKLATGTSSGSAGNASGNKGIKK